MSKRITDPLERAIADAKIWQQRAKESENAMVALHMRIRHLESQLAIAKQEAAA